MVFGVVGIIEKLDFVEKHWFYKVFWHLTSRAMEFQSLFGSDLRSLSGIKMRKLSS